MKKKYCKVKDHRHYTAKYRNNSHRIGKLKYSIPQKSKWFFIMDQIAYEKILKDPITKEVRRNDKNIEQITKAIS